MNIVQANESVWFWQFKCHRAWSYLMWFSEMWKTFGQIPSKTNDNFLSIHTLITLFKNVYWSENYWLFLKSPFYIGQINLSIYRGICINVITSSSMPNYSPFLTIFNAFFSNDIHSQEWKELYFVQQTWWLGVLSFIFSFRYKQQIHFYTYNSQINKWRGFH